MKKSLLAIFACPLFLMYPMFGQDDLQLSAKDSLVTSAWLVGVGINIVDDSATPLSSDFLNIKETWNMVPYPSQLSLGRTFKNGIGLTAIASYNKYKVGKKVDGAINLAERHYLAIDGMLGYDLNKLIGETGWFDPYVQAGVGFSQIGDFGRGTANGGLGFHIWMKDRWALNFNTMGKWGLGEAEKSTKQVQHAAGLVYRFGLEKELSKKGMEKLALIEANQRMADSLLAAKNAEEEARLLAERLAQEKEKSDLAAAEKAKIDAENKRKQDLRDKIDGLGHVYFDLNSSYLNSKAKQILDAMATLLSENPNLHLEVSSHTDSRGRSEYNKWLSQRRVQRTVDYLVTLGITPQRLAFEAYGEEKLLNECDDNTYCDEEKHQINRRSEFIITKF